MHCVKSRIQHMYQDILTWMKIACYNWILNSIFLYISKITKMIDLLIHTGFRVLNDANKRANVRSICPPVQRHLVGPASCLLPWGWRRRVVGRRAHTRLDLGSCRDVVVTSCTMTGPWRWRTCSVGAANRPAWGSVRVTGPGQTQLPLNPVHPSAVMKHFDWLRLLPHCA